MMTHDPPRRSLTSFRRCERGISAVEFAIVAPILFLIIFGMIEVALIAFVAASAEGGLQEAARFGVTGQLAEDDAAREQEILKILDEHLMGLVDLSEATITFRAYDSFSDVGQPEPFTDAEPLNGVYDVGEVFVDLNGNGKWDEDRGIEGVGNAGNVILYRIDFTWKLLTPIVAQVMGDFGRLPMSASIVVRNEPWDPTHS